MFQRRNKIVQKNESGWIREHCILLGSLGVDLTLVIKEFSFLMEKRNSYTVTGNVN
jgi:hypothetical protein